MKTSVSGFPQSSGVTNLLASSSSCFAVALRHKAVQRSRSLPTARRSNWLLKAERELSTSLLHGFPLRRARGGADQVHNASTELSRRERERVGNRESRDCYQDTPSTLERLSGADWCLPWPIEYWRNYSATTNAAVVPLAFRAESRAFLAGSEPWPLVLARSSLEFFRCGYWNFIEAFKHIFDVRFLNTVTIGIVSNVIRM